MINFCQIHHECYVRRVAKEEESIAFVTNIFVKREQRRSYLQKCPVEPSENNEKPNSQPNPFGKKNKATSLTKQKK